MNIFEGAKFGDKFRTRDGRIAIYQMYNNGWHYLITENATILVWSDGCVHSFHISISTSDIIGKLEEPINEEELDRLAFEHVEPLNTIPDDWFNKKRTKLIARSAYEAGYRKAKEQ